MTEARPAESPPSEGDEGADRKRRQRESARDGRLPWVLDDLLGQPANGRRLLDGLDQREDVALGVVEPCDLGAARGDDTARAPVAGHVVVLECNTAACELGDLALYVVDLPECLARTRRAGIFRGIEEARGAIRELVNDSAGNFLF